MAYDDEDDARWRASAAILDPSSSSSPFYSVDRFLRASFSSYLLPYHHPLVPPTLLSRVRRGVIDIDTVAPPNLPDSSA